jgi:hypothetical protein
VAGSRPLVHSLCLQAFPLILGSGARLYPGSDKRPLELVSSKAVPSGVLLQTYRVETG